MSNAFSGVGTKFRRYNGSDWVDMTEVKSIQGPSMTREMIDVTTLDSTGGYREFIPSFRDAGTVTLAMFFTYTGYIALKADFESDTMQQYQVLLPDNTAFTFYGYVQDLPINVTFDDAVASDLTIKITGEVTVAEVVNDYPVPNTLAVTNIASDGARFNMSLSSQGTSAVTEYGWKVDTVEANVTTETPTFKFYTSGTYPYPDDYEWGSNRFGSLDPNTLYYYVVYAINSSGVAYGTVLSFTTTT